MTRWMTAEKAFSTIHSKEKKVHIREETSMFLKIAWASTEMTMWLCEAISSPFALMLRITWEHL